MLGVRATHRRGLKGRKYELRDEFSDTVAAGALNNTVQRPGGVGTNMFRAVDDTENKVFNANGYCFISPKAAPSASDPILSLANISSIFGKAGNWSTLNLCPNYYNYPNSILR